MPEEIEETGGKVGSVSASRYAEIVAELRKLVETASRIQFTIGDYALEVEPMREYGGQERSDDLFTVKNSLFGLAEDIGVSYSMVKQARWTASRWPKEHRVEGVSFTVHRILAGIADDEERFEVLRTPPEGKTRWTPDEANRRAGRQVVKPVTAQEKVSAIHSLAQDEEVAATVTCCGARRLSRRSSPRTKSGWWRSSPVRTRSRPRSPRRSCAVPRSWPRSSLPTG